MKIHFEDSSDDETKESLKVKTVKVLTWLIYPAGLILLAYAGYMFVSQMADYVKSSNIYEDADREYVSAEYDEATVTEEKDWKDLVTVDISGLREVNPDIIGWIYFENESISYPVLHSGDNSKYLRRTYTGASAGAGSIFMEGKNNKDFSDAHTIIYGHNMKDLSMFGKLKYYITKTDYINDHRYFQIITEKEKFRYKILFCKVVLEDDSIYTVYKEGNRDFLNFVEKDIRNGSYWNPEVTVESGDHLLTLSTCSHDDDRLVITAVRCDEFAENN